MTRSARAAAPLAVLGAAVLAAAIWPAPSTADASSPRATAAASRPPAATVALARRPGAPAVRTRRRRAHHRAVPHASRRASARSSTSAGTRRPPHAAAPRIVRHRRAVAAPTTWPALNAAIARIPSYAEGTARWVVSSRYGHWGTADWYHGVIYVAPSVPAGYLYDVAVHEWSHELSVRDYGGDVDAAVRAMDTFFGGSGLVGAERAADCMAILQGATWTDYTSCRDRRWRAGAGRLLHGGRL